MLVALQQGYGKSLKWVLNHTRLVGVVLLGTIALNIWLYISIPKTFFPEAGHWRVDGRDSGGSEYFVSGDAR
ncbi:multidrug resistance protein [Escherichia coli]|uniref:Multidrug resistance protein n=1 Tax=Escherichia coli TaxID=562 RepID=A0A376KV95_ECOLX|nr:multidrug resistance protein [Escherichia coli]